MTRMVADANVVVKWVLPEREAEANAEQALARLKEVTAGRISLHQPPHWLAEEVAAVLVRLSPSTAAVDVADLSAMHLPVENGPEIYHLGCELVRSLNRYLVPCTTPWRWPSPTGYS